MEQRSLEMKRLSGFTFTLFTSTKSTEVFSGLGYNISK
jgi:hypothetical protein